jgi:hypothetical protein
MSNETTTPTLSEDEVREIVNRWGGAGFFRLRNMGDKIFIDEVTRGAAYTVRLQTHYEERRVHRASEPYYGGAVDNRGRAPGHWQVPVERPGPFEERTERVVVPHTERVEMCDGCGGEGRVACPGCGGQGRVTCPACGGMGFIEEQVLDPTSPSQGNAGPSIRTVRRGCRCSGGQVVCSGCGGNCVVRCSSCAGSGRVKTYDQVVVRFLTATQGEVLDVTPVPDPWLGRLSGEVLVDEKAPRLEGCPEVPDAVAQKANELLAASHDFDPKQSRLLLQLLHVERLPLHEVKYKYAGVERQLWICGAEQAVHAPGAPWNRQRLFGVIAGAVAAVALAVALLVFLVTR